MVLRRFAFLLLALLVGSGLWPGSPRAQPTILAQSPRPTSTGDAIARFNEVWTHGKGVAFYEGAQHAIMTAITPGVFSTRVLTGDPLPLPLLGTFNEFEYPVINDMGDIVFRALCNDATIHDGYFIFPAGGGALVHVNAAFPSAQATNPADINASRDVVWLDKNLSLYLYDDATGTNTLIAERNGPAPGGATWRTFGLRPVIGNGGEVAFVAQQTDSRVGVFLYQPGTGAITTLALTGDPAPQGAGTIYDRIDERGAVIAIDDAGNVAFTAELSGGAVDAAAFLVTPTGGTEVVAELGDAVTGGGGGAVLEEIRDDFIAIDDLGRVAILGDADAGLGSRILLQPAVGSGGPLSIHSPPVLDADGYFSPRLTYSTAPAAGSTLLGDSGRVHRLAPGPSADTIVERRMQTPIGLDVWSFHASINHGGQISFVGRHPELYVDSLAAPGALSLHEAGDTSPAVAGYTTQRLISHVAHKRHGAFMVQDDGPPPGVLQKSHAIAYVRLNNPAFVQLVAETFFPVPPPVGGTMNLGSATRLAMRGRRVYFVSAVTGGTAPAALFEGRPGLPPQVVVALGAPTPVGTFADIDDVFLEVAGKHLVFSGLLEGPPLQAGVFVMNPRKPSSLRAVALEGEPFPAGGLFEDFGRISLNRKGQVLFGAESDLGIAGIFLDDGVTRSTLVLDGDPVPATLPGGGTFDFDAEVSFRLDKKGRAVMALPIDGSSVDFDGLFLYPGPTGGLAPLALAPSTPVASVAGASVGALAHISNGQPLMVWKNGVVGSFGMSLAGAQQGILGIPW